MGANIARRIQKHAVTPVNIAVFDVNPDTIKAVASEGFTPLNSLTDLAQFNDAANPQFVWVMVPAAVTDSTIAAVADVLSPGDTIIDGGNSYYKNDLKNATLLKEKGINFVDVGTSGGVYGLERGYSLMIGGDKEVTLATSDTTAVAGVVSTNPAHLMNGGLTGPNVVALALTGRVPCNVIGPVKKGDLMVAAGLGRARSESDPKVGTVIGKALENNSDGDKIEVVVGRL